MDKKIAHGSNIVYIEWLVAFAVSYATTFTVTESFMEIFNPNLRVVLGLFRNVVIFFLLIYQIQHYGLDIRKKGLLFFIFYSFFILLYITAFPYYKLEDLAKAPSSVFNFFYRSFQVLIYILCIQTIVLNFNVTKYLVTSLIIATIPTIYFMQYIGFETIQFFKMDKDSDYISLLSMGYSNAYLIPLTVLFYKKLFSNKLISIVFASIVFLITCTVVFLSGERGPILWAMVTLFICLFLIAKHSRRYIVIVVFFVILLLANIDFVIDSLRSFAPRAAEKIEMTVKEGDTNGRFDMDNKQSSTYLIGLNQFASSPLYGSYFRLIANGPFRGHYPHNAFIEVLITMGLLGFIPFIYLLSIVWKKVRKLLKGSYTDNQLACVSLFLSEFFLLMTSSTILFDTAFWCFFVVLCNIDMNIEAKSKNGRLNPVIMNKFNKM